MCQEIDREHDQQVIEQIRQEYSLEDELKVLRRAMTRLFIELGSALDEDQIKNLNSSNEMKDFWRYHEFVQDCFRPGPGDEEDLEQSMEDVNAEIAATLLGDLK